MSLCGYHYQDSVGNVLSFIQPLSEVEQYVNGLEFMMTYDYQKQELRQEYLEDMIKSKDSHLLDSLSAVELDRLNRAYHIERAKEDARIASLSQGEDVDLKL